MKIAIIHLSDLHYRLNWEEDQGLVLEAFFKDLAKQLTSKKEYKFFLAFSGDIVLAGSKSELYSSFIEQFSSELDKINILKDQRICVPGNHDVSIDVVIEKHVEHEGVVAQKLNEKDFNDFISSHPDILEKKFNNYMNFEK